MLTTMKDTIHPARLGALAGYGSRFVPIHLCYDRLIEDKADDMRFSPVSPWTKEMEIAYEHAWLTAYERGQFHEGKQPTHFTAPAAKRHGCIAI